MKGSSCGWIWVFLLNILSAVPAFSQVDRYASIPDNQLVGNVYGTVVDATTSEPIRNAEIFLLDQPIRKGRSLEGFVKAHLTFISVGRDYESAERVWVERLSKRYAQDFGPLAKKYGIIGTPEQCAEKLQRFIEAGCSYFVLDAICDAADEAEQIERFAADLFPKFQGR